MAIQEYPYQLDETTLEIFPKEISSDPYVVYHGTADHHAQSIEKHGFTRGISPYDLGVARQLVDLLGHPDIAPFDTPRAFNMRLSQVLENYILGIERNEIKISFSAVSYGSVQFACGHLKGGQTLGKIRDAKEMIDNAILANASVESLITSGLNDLLALPDVISESKGVVYAIRLDPSLMGIVVENNIVYSKNPIGPECIVGKVYVPDNTSFTQEDRKRVNDRVKQKLFSTGGLGVIINRRDFKIDREDLNSQL